MNKQMHITYNDKEYTLEFTRRTVQQLEAQGFAVDELAKKPATMLPLLFQGAFLSRHRGLNKDVIEDIFAHIPDKQGLIGKLAEMYTEPIAALVDEPESSEGNAVWTADW